ncbi:hypothetical protein [Streptomyces scopuliridis]|uniref:hypothetical protein n=1 Tax=Streptomyces scopuliridis TaxID=452529 RepID=UPI0036B154ED
MGSPDDLETLRSAADQFGVKSSEEVEVHTASEVYLLPDWRRCSLAVADVTMAEVLGLPIRDMIPADLLAAAS